MRPTVPTRSVVVGIVIVAALVVLAACGSGGGSEAGGPASTASASTSDPVDPPTTTAAGARVAGVARDTAVTEQGAAYAERSPSQTLDLYLPVSDGSAPVPVVVLIHGGAFRMGDSSMETAYAQELVDRGTAAASINYRLSGEATFPAGAQDVKAAVRWLRANAATYGLDPDHIGAWGQSAGGWMANMLGATGDQATVFDDGDLGNEDQSSEVQAVASWFGPTDFTTMDEQAADSQCAGQSQVHGTADSPESAWLGAPVATSALAEQTDISAYLDDASTLPAWYLAHGDADCNVPGGQSTELADALEAAGADVTYVVLPGADHMDPAFDSEQLQPTLDFLVESLGG